MISTKENDILCSIVMPAYNVGCFIERMLESIIAQTYQNWELIVVNDGSTDNTEAILKRYSQSDARITYISQTNSGVGTARANGISKAKGKYLFQIDGDDKLEPNFIEELLHRIDESQSDLVWCNCHPNEDSNEIWNLSFEEDVRAMIKAILLRKQFYALWLCVFRTDIAKECIDSMQSVSFCEDWAFFVAYLLKCKKIEHIDKALYYYNITNINSATHNKRISRIKEYELAVSKIQSSLEFSGRLGEFEYELNYAKLFVVRDYIDDKRFRDINKFAYTYPEAIAHIYEYKDYPNRLKVCAWLIKRRLGILVPFVCRIDSVLQKIGLSKQ